MVEGACGIAVVSAHVEAASTIATEIEDPPSSVNDSLSNMYLHVRAHAYTHVHAHVRAHV